MPDTLSRIADILRDQWLTNPAFQYTLLVTLGLPLVVLILTEIHTRMRSGGHPLAGSLALVRSLLLPAIALYLFLGKVSGMAPDHWGVRLAETAAWLSGLYVVLTLINDLLFSAANEASWRSRVPSLSRDLIRAGLVTIGAPIVYSQVWAQPLEGAVTALGVGSIVIGLALQEPLGNIVSGLMLMFERPIKLGDFVSIDDNTGYVVEINWRSVHVQTPVNGVRVIPNSQLYKGSFNNLSRPSRMRTELIELGFSYDDPPNRVKEMLLGLLADTPGILKDPAPVVRTVNYADFAIIYRVIFSVGTSEELPSVRDAFMSKIWYAIRRHGITIPFPTATEIQVDQQTLSEQGAQRPLEALAELPALKSLLDSPRDEQLEAGLQQRSFGKGEIITREGQRIDGLHVVVRGTALLTVRNHEGQAMEIARVTRGEYFGEGSVLAELPSEVTVIAAEDLELVVVSPPAMFRLMGRAPALSRQLGNLMETRRKTVLAARQLRAGA